MKHPRLSVLAATSVVALLSGCGAMHGHHHGGHHGGMGKGAATAPAQISLSQPMLSSGYQKVAAPDTAKVYFINLKNGDTVSSPVRVQFGLSGMGVAPAGIEKAGTGHHHLLVNVANIDANAPLPADNHHRHFGAGQTETTLELPPGPHTLQLLLADQNHIPHHPVVLSERITITVK